METQSRYDIFEQGDLTSLVCVDVPEIQNSVVEQLAALEYKIHTGLFHDDVALKLRSHDYDIVVVYENFNEWDIETNQILREVTTVPAELRRKQFIVLLGPSMVTDEAMQAFVYSVDLTFSLSDLPNFKSVLRRAIKRQRDFYAVFQETLGAAGMT
jgi:hypothetical protein